MNQRVNYNSSHLLQSRDHGCPFEKGDACAFQCFAGNLIKSMVHHGGAHGEILNDQ
jgi:hypothetical protein